MSSKPVLEIEGKSLQREAARLLKQYGCGPIQFTGADGLYERHLLFDHVKDVTMVGARDSAGRWRRLRRSLVTIFACRYRR